MKAYAALTAAGLRAFLRDRQAFFWTIFFPLFFVFLFGSVFGKAGEGEIHIKVGVVGAKSSPMSQGIVTGMLMVPVFEIHEGTLESEIKAMKAGDRRIIVVMPDSMPQPGAGESLPVRVLTDPTQPQITQAAVGIVRDVFARADTYVSGHSPLFRVAEEPLASGGKGQPRYIDFLLPGILAMTIMQLGLFTAIPIITMREKGILKRYRATPLPRPTLVAAQVTQRLVISLAQTAIILGAGVLVYKARVVGPWPLLIAFVSLGVVTFICMGAVLSALAKTQESGSSMVQMANLPMMFLSGVFFPTEMLPQFLRPLVAILPSTYLVDGIRHVATAAPTPYSLGKDMAVLGAWLIGSLLVASRTLRWE